MSVITSEGLVGYVDQVFAETARVRLLTDPTIRVSVINNRNREIGVLAGQLNNPLEINYINLNSDVQDGDVFLTSGASFRYQRGLPVARVTRVQVRNNDYYKQVKAEPLADFSQLDIVFCVR